MTMFLANMPEIPPEVGGGMTMPEPMTMEMAMATTNPTGELSGAEHIAPEPDADPFAGMG